MQEEPAEMFGMRHLCDVTLPERGIGFDLMVSSEATNLDLSLGHRGRAEIEVITYGRTSHGSAPWRGRQRGLQDDARAAAGAGAGGIAPR